MDTAVKKSNKENSKPEAGPKRPESRNVTSKQKLTRPAPLRSKNEPREENAGDKPESKAQLKPSRPAESKDSDPTQRKTLSQAFRTEQTLRHRKLVLETQKPPLSVPPKPLLPGTYKGRVVRSKIDCFRKPPNGHEKKPGENKPKAETAVRSKTATTLSASSRAGVQSGVVSRTTSWSDARVNTQKTVPQRRIQTKAPAQTATISTKPSTVSTKPSTISTKPSTFSTKPSTISTKPSTFSTKPSTISTKPSTFSTKPSTISTKPSTVSTKPSTISSKPSTISKKPSTISTKPSTISAKSSTVSTKPSMISRKPVMMSARPPTVTSFIKKKEPSKPAAAASEQKPQKSVSGAIGQYRVRVESAEERRAKLAEWLASKGKTLKRPAMTEKSAAQTWRSRPEAEDEEEARPEAEDEEEARPEAEDEEEARPEAEEEARPEPEDEEEARPEAEDEEEARPEAEDEEEARPEASKGAGTERSNVPQTKPAFSSSPSHILNTTLDLLDDSDTELPAEPEIRMESLVINLCERLEEMETPSSCKSRGSADSEVEVEEETPEYEILEEEEEERREEERGEEELMDTDGGEKKEEKEEVGAGDKKTLKIKTEEEKKLFEGEEEEEDEEEEMDSTPADVLDACVVKYSVKTTPFLQSVKKRMEGEMAPGTPGSRRKSSIKELKFLTPVRRSSRIHRNSSRLPGMLNEHDPCVSSLAELELLDAADSNAYIYRRNPALLQHLPDQRPEPQSSQHTCQ